MNEQGVRGQIASQTRSANEAEAALLSSVTETKLERQEEKLELNEFSPVN